MAEERPKHVTIPGTISYWNPYRKLPGYLPATRTGLAEYICALSEIPLDLEAEWFKTASDYELINSAVDMTLRADRLGQGQYDTQLMREN